ncbi:MAG: rod shape-determining protein MreC [Chlamydiia bacterium]|nr:rod shape-determining protein MreC [Chlamydiia bacterium]
MMKPAALTYVLLGCFLVAWVNLPRPMTERLRSATVALFSSVHKPKVDGEKLELQRLQVQNQQLRAKLETACEWLAWEKKRKEGVGIAQECPAIPALVVYRDPSSWNSSLWVRAGEADNQKIGEKIVAKNSPVVFGSALVGVVDYVGKRQSRVRLITDSGVVPAVRAVRGGAQNRELASLCKALCQRLENREDLKEELQGLIERLSRESTDLFLAKGEIHGSSAPFWRSRSLYLKGVGFNYEYPDKHGKSHDLHDSILKAGDLLVTSGLDGVFPEGLVVGHVVRVEPLQEGSYSYDLIAKPALGSMHEIKTVFILPPLE